MKLEIIGKIVFMLLLLGFALAFFWMKQYMFAFLTLVVLLVFTKWDRVKKIVAGRGRVEMQVFDDKGKKKEE